MRSVASPVTPTLVHRDTNMAHREQLAFVESVKNRYPAYFYDCNVLEIGSRDVNGSVRPLFTDCQYTGVDCIAGPGVDWVGLAHEYRSSDRQFATIVSCETFEHDPYLRQTLDTICDLLKPRGLFVATFAGPSRVEHGTTRTETKDELIYGPDATYYHNLSAAEFADMIGERFRYLEITVNRDGQDIYVIGR